MTYQPVIPLGGYAGWTFLQRTRDAQQAAFDNSAQVVRETEYFRDKIGGITTAGDLVKDRRLLQVALGAFGLEDDINNKYFLQKVLEEGTLDTDSLANKLSDTRYHAFAKAFGFGDYATPRTVLSDFPDEIVDAYRTKSFEVAVGEADPTMRLALGLDAALTEIAEKATTADGRWFSVMGQTSVRTVFETALGLPTSVGVLDIDRQLTEFRTKTQARFGDGEIAQFTDPAKREELLRLFLLNSDGSAGTSTQGASAALALLQSSGTASAGSLLSIING